MNSVKQALSNQGKRKTTQSRITPIVRMGQPVQSKYTRAAERISDPSLEWGYVKGGDIAAGLTSGLKSYLAFRGAAEDAKNQQAYNDNLAKIAEQERQDKLAQQEFDNQYKLDQLAQQMKIAEMSNQGANSRAEQQHQWAVEMENAKRQQAKAENDLALRRQGIDPELYGVDDNYTAQINQALKQQAVQDQLNAASVELGKSGKVGMDQVSESVSTGKPLTYGDNGWISNMLGINKFGIGKTPRQQPATPADITRQYQQQLQAKAQQRQPMTVVGAQAQANGQNPFAQMSDNDLIKGL